MAISSIHWCFFSNKLNLKSRRRQHGLSPMLHQVDPTSRFSKIHVFDIHPMIFLKSRPRSLLIYDFCIHICRFLVAQGCIKPLCDLLLCPDPRIVTVCLEGLENILKVGEADKERGLNGGINVFAVMIDDCEGSEKIEHLQTHDNNEIYEKAVKILESYWAEEEVEGVGDGNGNAPAAFQFGSDHPSVPQGGFKFG